MALTLSNRPTLVDYGPLHFLIMDAPTDSNLHLYVKELNKFNVKHVVRVCDPTYSTDVLRKEGITVHHWPYPDGASPPDHVLNEWLALLKTAFGKPKEPHETIAVHCVAGLGRAPVLVAVALIEEGMEPLDAVQYIRDRRRGAINAKQLKWLETYKRRRKGSCCVVQ